MNTSQTRSLPADVESTLQQYLDRVRAATAPLPADARDELLTDLREHVQDAVRQDPHADPGQLARQAMDELGSPAEIAASIGIVPARPRGPWLDDDQRRAGYDVATVLTLLAGLFVVPFAGWLVGVVMLWAGPRWNRREKVLGTAVWPLAAGLPMAAATFVVPGDIAGLVTLAATMLLLVPATHLLLYRAAARRRAGAPAGAPPHTG